jgi:hypothetical protein
MYFIAWLYLCCGLSQARCCEAVTYIIYLIKQCRQLPPNVTMESKIPKDVRTLTKRLKLDPTLESYTSAVKNATHCTISRLLPSGVSTKLIVIHQPVATNYSMGLASFHSMRYRGTLTIDSNQKNALTQQTRRLFLSLRACKTGLNGSYPYPTLKI